MRRTLDSAILIRTADIDPGGPVRISVGATLVRHSSPMAEAAETRAKAAVLRAALEFPRPSHHDRPLQPQQEDRPKHSMEPHRTSAPRLGTDPLIRAALTGRNADIAAFWRVISGGIQIPKAPPALRGDVLVIDAEDTFTSMLRHQLTAMGMAVTVRRFDEPHDLNNGDLVVLGPGPGDPRDQNNSKIAYLGAATRTLLAAHRPFLAVCLSHQVLSLELGLNLVRRTVPNQGTQKRINLFGNDETVGFYNTFAARSAEDKLDCPKVGIVEISRDGHTGEVHALRGPGFASMQFHPESVLTLDGPRIIAEMLAGIAADHGLAGAAGPTLRWRRGHHRRRPARLDQ